MTSLLDRFLNYVAIDSQSRPQAKQVPSSEGQWQMAELLKTELQELGLVNISLSEHGIVMATLPGNVDWPVPAIGFIAHVDTSPDFTARHVQPQLIENYRGGDIALGMGDEILSPVRFPVLHQLIGHTLITTNGKTLLGADDKAGVAEIMTAITRLKHGNQPHGDIHIAFTPDEEIGRGAHFFDVDLFGADWAYTVDGGGLGEFEYENFNAASVLVKITGNNVHPGTAKNVMVNALDLAMRFQAAIPQQERPEHTEGYEGFYHLHSIKGTVESAEMHYIIRDHQPATFADRKAKMLAIADDINRRLDNGCGIELTISDSYYNMREKVAAHPHIIELALQAMRDCGVEPLVKPIRGGTDGAALSYKGLPCPNLFTGGFNYHGKHEFASLDIMQKSVEVIIRIAQLTAEGVRPH
ncbi:peptidase T [Erwinia sp. OLTSP20]|uniref:peptidase T n=1 Tax=unclassified Erwinia TaxID=2622719 RepID=UPI000C1A6995|nr:MULTISPECIES: peptidase T [unclassified Erwinia]PIJ51959.1 peptidase T [Erwinia sp. OAMSP11]PIJ74834.1 peptidase T [Erwinia sp. OLSSP12]PIJ85220.1 peptidase T [Erwinia sp. OLCASP19]PIJ87221.1 peptidase T [Erwinia sp. OLMTSP26]PIJ88365.1 peptidase T [Erwinia sp. OLMDSP33]